ncbi:hypothetical protein H8B13_13605 [Hymenobacter sp. BT188]|uniref:hypothetical protein n=1 Tax=Hymenobacter sp. BT188 TaxID=2763504 RepID=UPI001650E713|nr:hypothetical protein [Hymenobacter sp. BT188]MBC6607857.1 hypothetical protein [Hymenobacter sp. BT188]
MNTATLGDFFRVILLPLLLLAMSIGGLGAYYETNDDLIITQLLRGVTAAAPVTDLHLYFHGFAPMLAALYAQFPAVPWYGLSLYSLLYTALVLLFAVLNRLLADYLTSEQINLVLIIFFCLVFIENSLWFNYMRVPLLLAGAGGLFAAQRTDRSWAIVVGLVAFGLAWLIRPSAAVLGLLVAVPGGIWLGQRRGAYVLAAALLLAGVGGIFLTFTRSPEATRFRVLDVLKSNLNDFQLYQPQPKTTLDTLGVQAVNLWILSDSMLVNEDFFQRTSPKNADYFLCELAPTKLAILARLVVRDYFPLLLLNALIFVSLLRSSSTRGRLVFWLTQLGFASLILIIGIGLKLPPRLGLPLFTLFTLGNVAYWLRPSITARVPFPRLAVGVLVLVTGVYGYKTLHRKQLLAAERFHHEAYLTELNRATAGGQILVTANLEVAYKSLSPFQIYDLPGPQLPLTGWATLHPSLPTLRQELTGTRDFGTSLYRLAERPGVQWVLAPEVVPFLQRYSQYSSSSDRLGLTFTLLNRITADSTLPQLYEVRPRIIEKP